MARKCANCAAPLEEGWIACPHCGRSVRGATTDHVVLKVASKIIPPLLEAGLKRAQSSAEKRGWQSQAELLALTRQLSRELSPLILEAVAAYSTQRSSPGPRRAGNRPIQSKGVRPQRRNRVASR
jgi:uncharacterized Zn finger protein (UPF0148 family)